MIEITIGGQETRVRATPLALLFYKQEFNGDLVGDLIKLEAIKKDPTAFDSITLLQITWAMAKADNPENFPSFYKWLETLESFDFTDTEMLTALMEEATAGFFRAGGIAAKQQQRKRSK
jgi:hypothetical protein